MKKYIKGDLVKISAPGDEFDARTGLIHHVGQGSKRDLYTVKITGTSQVSSYNADELSPADPWRDWEAAHGIHHQPIQPSLFDHGNAFALAND